MPFELPIQEAPRVTPEGAAPGADDGTGEASRPETPPEPKRAKKFKAVITETSHLAQSEARDVGERAMTANKEQLSGFTGFLKKIWKHNIAEGFYQRLEYDRALKKIQEDQNIYADTHASDEVNERTRQAHDIAMQSVVERFAQEYDDQDIIHADIGEKRDTLSGSPEAEALKKQIKDLIASFARGDIDEDAFDSEKTRILMALPGVSRDVVGTGDMYATNLLEIAKEVRGALGHQLGVEAVDFELEVVIGRARHGVRTEAQLNAMDTILEKLQSSRAGFLFNETSVASGLQLAYSVAGYASKRVATSKAAAWGTFGASALLGGGIAAWREKLILQKERAQHSRDTARGREFDPAKAPRRKELHETQYETTKATDLVDALESSMYDEQKDGTKTVKKFDQAQLDSALQSLIAIESRIKLSDQRKIDLVSYSNNQSVEIEQTRLDLARAKAKRDLRETIAKSGLVLPGNVTFDEYVELFTLAAEGQLRGGDRGIDKKDEAFRALRNRRMTKRFVQGVTIGMVIGGAAQEARALMSDQTEGLTEHILREQGWIGSHGQPAGMATPLEEIRRWVQDDYPRFGMDHMHDMIVNGGHIKLPEGVDLITDPNGTYNLVHGTDVIAEHIPFNADGTLTAEGSKILQEHGVLAGTTINHIAETVNTTKGAEDIIREHDSEFRHAKRLLWFDNDTPKPTFDKNELKLWWGGEGGTGIDAQGNYVFNVKHMMADGSFHDKLSANAQELMKAGKLKLLLSLSENTQGNVVEIPIDVQGNAIIDPESETGKLFFSAVNDKAHFLGKYAEVAEMLDAKDGADQVRILATHVGDGVSELPGNGDVVRDVATTTMDVPAPHDYEVPWVVPLLSRTPLEAMKSPSDYMGYLRDETERKTEYEKRRSRSLNTPFAKLDQYRETQDYLKRQTPEQRTKIEQLAKQVDEPMDKACRVAVCVPVAGHQEGENIYHTLSKYATQQNMDGNPLDTSSFEVVLYVNHPKDKKLDKTLDEITRFKRDNPNMHVRTIYKALDRDEAKIGSIRKDVTDVALLRHHKRGPRMPDLILVSNDADCRDMSPNYIASLQNKFEKNKSFDGVLGKIDWEAEAYLKSPLLHIGTRFFQYLDAAYRHHKDKGARSIGSSGANFAFKSSIYAAIGGYLENDEIAEDRHLGEMMKLARRGTGEYAVGYGGAEVADHNECTERR